MSRARRSAPGSDARRGAAAQAPYRGGPDRAPEVVPPEDGLVGDLIRQFADPLAFYRELVQNAIDAGATRIVVKIVAEDAAGGDAEAARGIARVSVSDDGSGMSRETLEEELTVLFRSSKESRDDAIGKFGIGFVSVLAVAPEVVIVETSIGDGVRWSLHLHPDQTYDLYRAESGGGRGTTVTLHVPVAPEDRRGFVQRSEQALTRWCEHARVPIQLVALEPGSGEPLREARIDRPLAIDALVSIHARSRDGHTVVVAGLPGEGGRSGAFYNQGLLLHHTRDHELGEVAFKVMDHRLEHTLSRDDVRRDAHYERAIELVASTIRGPLLDGIADALSGHALAWARGGDEGGRRFLEILAALARAGLEVPADRVRWPVIAGGGLETATLASLRGCVLTLCGRTPLTEALAASGIRVLDASFARTEAERRVALDAIAAALERTPTLDVEGHTLLEPIEPTPSDADLVARTAAHLAAVARAPSELVIARVHGRAASRLALAGGARGTPWVVGDDVDADPFRLLLRPPLVVREGHPVVAAARARAASAPVLASILLARAILVARGLLDPARDEALTERGLREALGTGGAR